MIRLLCVVCTLLASPAFAEQTCGPHDAMADNLAEKYGDTVKVMGVTPDKMLMEVYVNETSGTWTAAMTTQAGISCYAAIGAEAKVIKPGVPS